PSECFARITPTPSGPAHAIKTSPTGCPSWESGPATPVNDTAHVASQTQRVPFAMATAVSGYTTPYSSTCSCGTCAKATLSSAEYVICPTSITANEHGTCVLVAQDCNADSDSLY